MRWLLILMLALMVQADDGFWHAIPRTINEIKAPTDWKAETKNEKLVLTLPTRGTITISEETKLQASADLETVARVHLTRWNNRADKYTFKNLEGVAAGKIRGYKVTVEVSEVESAPHTAYSYVFPGLLPGDYLWIWNPEGLENDRVDLMAKSLRRRQ